MKLLRGYLPDTAGVARLEHRPGYSPHGDVVLVEVRDLAVFVRHQNAVAGGLERGSHHRERMRELVGLELQGFFRLKELLFGALPREQDRLRRPQRGSPQQMFRVVVCLHYLP
jgi:hypothetical protein